MTGMHPDERGLISRSMLLWLILAALLGIFIIDGTSILFTKWQMSDVADAAAVNAAVAYRDQHSRPAAMDAALSVLADRDPDAVIKPGTRNNPDGGLVIDPTTGEVTITLMKDAKTIFLSRIGLTKELIHLQVTSTQGAS